ncbi:SDR family NAD(P)-dependent oxidoreductase [Shimia abyssi]|uniref:NAD(P)-dependent dehydrogenase (Short-subunit alcohol dehydrogenase family) n=1 Tax=Shimia abyssi TaxID=1662395 RepID=A0A2P8FCE5_9RHOB|nr:SDR family oxidoreductase [Shimia abyssi]PSL19385.1 NAD(P)-dependent dehydrogenase (short-subunit alcohol dehydrogenase family) [Shimia abyssi]
MTKDFNDSAPDTTNRRAFLTGGGLALASAVAAGAATANTSDTELSGQANPNGRFSGKVVAITGGNSGIGKATAEAFAMEGAKVFITARRDALGKEVESAIRAKGGDVTWMVTDVREAAQVERFINAVVEQGGKLDVLFNNAGIFMTPALVEDISVENFQDMMATNVEGVFYGMKYALPQMKKQGGGSIVNMASVAAHRGFGFTGHYSASKHAVRGLTKAAAKVSAKDNIRVNSISPLAVDTPMLEESFSYQGVTYEQMAPNFVTPRIMDAHEMAVGVMFLASDEASAINGMDLDATGGQLA